MTLSSKRLLTAVASNTSLNTLSFWTFPSPRWNYFPSTGKNSQPISSAIFLDLPLICGSCNRALAWNSILSCGFQPLLRWDSLLRFLLQSARKMCPVILTQTRLKLPLPKGTTWAEDFGSWWVTPCFARLPAYKGFPELPPSQGCPKGGNFLREVLPVMQRTTGSLHENQHKQ